MDRHSYDLREMMREADRPIVNEIIREEKAHVRRLAALLGGARGHAYHPVTVTSQG